MRVSNLNASTQSMNTAAMAEQGDKFSRQRGGIGKA